MALEACQCSEKPGYHNRKDSISFKIRSLLLRLARLPSKYDQITPKVEYWIEYVLREQFITVRELVERVSYIAWEADSFEVPNLLRFLKEFRNVPHRSEHGRAFVDELCHHILRWFAITATENYHSLEDSVAIGGGDGFIRAASFVGQLIETGLLSHDLIRRHLIKPLITHGDNDDDNYRILAIHQLFVVAGSTLLQGLIEPNDAQLSFQILNELPYADKQKVEEIRELHAKWLDRKEEEQKAATESGEGNVEDLIATEVLPKDAYSISGSPVPFVPRDLPTTFINVPPSALLDVESSDIFIDTQAITASSPTSSILTSSDLTPTESSEGVGGGGAEPTTIRHETFYLEDGNVEILCGSIVFRVHSPIVSFSSRKLRDILSPSALLRAEIPEGCPRIAFADSAEDFAVLLKMIYTPGWAPFPRRAFCELTALLTTRFPARHEVPEFGVFASLLRMTTKYGYSSVRDQLVKDLGGAYPTRWEAYQTAEVVGEDVFGSPKPHPNSVLKLFSEQNIWFAVPFAAYRASSGGFSALMSDKPGAVLPHRTLATTTHGMHLVRALMGQAARAIVYEDNIGVCVGRKCVLSVGIEPFERRAEALKKLHAAFLVMRDGGELGPPSLGHLACARCTEDMQASHATWRSMCWERLPSMFSVARSWSEV